MAAANIATRRGVFYAADHGPMRPSRSGPIESKPLQQNAAVTAQPVEEVGHGVPGLVDQGRVVSLPHHLLGHLLFLRDVPLLLPDLLIGLPKRSSCVHDVSARFGVTQGNIWRTRVVPSIRRARQ